MITVTLAPMQTTVGSRKARPSSFPSKGGRIAWFPGPKGREDGRGPEGLCSSGKWAVTSASGRMTHCRASPGLPLCPPVYPEKVGNPLHGASSLCEAATKTCSWDRNANEQSQDQGLARGLKLQSLDFTVLCFQRVSLQWYSGHDPSF